MTEAGHELASCAQFRLDYASRSVSDFGAGENVDIESRIVPGQ